MLFSTLHSKHFINGHIYDRAVALTNLQHELDVIQDERVKQTHFDALPDKTKEKLDMLVDGPGCFFFLNLQNSHFTSDDYLDVFLELLNRVKSQKSTLILIFDSMELYDYFEKYLNIFEVYENRNAYKKSDTKKQLQQIGLYYGLRSGITVSSGVAVAFLSLILGWIVTLLIIIST